MGTRANNDVTAGARSIMQYCKSLQVKSGITATEFAAECGFSRNYWFVRARFDAPLTISDCERIANVCGMTLKELFTRALGSDAARAYEVRERLPSLSPSSVPACPRPDADDDVAAAIRDHERYGLAANTDGNRDVETETPDW